MKLYGTLNSPYVHRPLIVARLKGCELALDALPGVATNSPEFLAISATGRIPALEIAPGRHICESEAICGWLDETLPGPSVLGEDPDARAHARQIAAIAHNDIGNGMLPVVVHELFGIGGSAGEAATGRLRTARGLDAIERARDPAHAFAASDKAGWADAMLAPMLVFVALADAVTGAEPMLPSRPGLAGYLARARADAIIGRSLAEIEAGVKRDA